ncbi:MAG TPA: hypothetical protein DCX06_05465 [Opitutae bacterium]|nr:hypothetical protein [Opitutae bacterium]
MNKLLSTLLLCGVVVTLPTSAAELRIDPTSMNSLLLEDFSDDVDYTSELRNGVSFLSSSEGVARYQITNQLDPQLFFDGYVGGIDFAQYPNVRIRHGFTQKVKGSSVYPLPVRDKRMVSLGIHTVISGRQATLGTFPDNGSGLRIDPIEGPALAGVYSIDYIYVDRGRTLGFEFDETNSTRGGLNNYFLGNNLGGKNGKEILSGVEGGFYHGIPTSADPMMILQMSPHTGLNSINPKVYSFIEIRMRTPEPQAAHASIYFKSDAREQASQVEFELVNDEFYHTYLFDMRDNADWNSGTITSFRFDPTNRQQTFEIDSIRFYEIAKLD